MSELTPIKNQIEESLLKLKNYGSDSNYSINKLNLWLNNNLALYTFCKANWNNNSIYAELPDCNTLNSDELNFVELYFEIKKITELHILETTCKNEILYYKSVKNSPSNVKLWLTKNEVLGSQTLASFIIDYLDYSDKPKNLKINTYYSNSLFNTLDFFIDRNEFIHTIKFLELFNELIYIQESHLKEIKSLN